MIQTRRNIFYRLTLAHLGGLVPLLITGVMLFYRFRRYQNRSYWMTWAGRSATRSVVREMVDGTVS
ncbi:MAG: hypothetical protein ACLR0F_26720 [Eisenbergiella sp.]